MPAQIYTALERHIEQPDFLSKLEDAKRRGTGSTGDLGERRGEEVLHEGWWDAPPCGMSDASAEGYTEVGAPLSPADMISTGMRTCLLCHPSDDRGCCIACWPSLCTS